MGKRLATIKYRDDKALREVADRLDLMLDYKEVWREARDYYEETDNDTAEVQVRGLDYIVIERR